MKPTDIQHPTDTAPKSVLDSGKSETSSLKIRFVSLLDKRQIDGMDSITGMLGQKGISVDHFEYKVIKKTEMHRPINPKLKDGPKEKVVIEEKVNVNANLKTVGQLEWRVLKDPENILIVQLNRTKGETLSLPLIFSNIFKQGRQILVTGLTRHVRLQLTSKPDLKFTKIPLPIEECPELKEQLIKRASRTKGMQATARELLDLPGLPEEITKKIISIATGKKEALSDAQAINMILLSDLHSRYSAMLRTFQNDIIERSGSVANLGRQFSIITQNIGTKFLVSKLIDFLGEEGVKSKNNLQVFTHLYQKLQKMEEKKIYVNKKLLDRKDLFKLFRSIVCIARSQFDPDCWNKCLFFLHPDDESTPIEYNQKTIDMLVSKARRQIMANQVAATRSLTEIHLIYNIHHYVFDQKISLKNNSIEKTDIDLIKNTIAPQLHLRFFKETKNAKMVFLFSESDGKIHKLINPLHCLGGAYGFLLGKILERNLHEFVENDLESRFARFKSNFFDILYEQLVFEKGLWLSRNQLAQWLELNQIVPRVEEKGYLENNMETDFLEEVTPQMLSGDGQTIFPIEYSKANFERDFLTSKKKFNNFFNRLKNHLASQNDPHNPASIFLKYTENGKHDLRSPLFRQYVKNTYLYEEFHRMVKQACEKIKSSLAEESVNKKIILKIPLQFSSLLFLGNTFEIPTGKIVVRARLQAVPVKSINESYGISKPFVDNFSTLLQQAETPERTGIIQAMRMLGEYQKVSMEYFKYLSVSVLDRQIHHMLSQQANSSYDPRFVKFKFSDNEKLIVGNMRHINLSKLLQFDFDPKKNEKDIVNNHSFGELIQAIMYYRSVVQKLNDRITVIQKLKELLDKFSDTMKEAKEWKSYFTLISRFLNLISLPIEAFTEATIKTLANLGVRMNKLVTKFEYKDSVIAILHAEWKRRNPGQVKKVYFYLPFLGDDVSGSKSNLLLEIRKARDLVKMFKEKRCLIFFPEPTKEIHLDQMEEINAFIRQHTFDIEQYIDTRTLNKEKVQMLSRTFHPKCFFQLEKLKPIKISKR